jgi:drug/metabolite transporter (DMT)-like permease
LTPEPGRRSRFLAELGPGLAVVLFGLLSAITWGAGDFGGGLLSRRAPLLTVVWITQAVGIVGALVVALILREPFPPLADIAFAAGAGIFGMAGIAFLYRGLAVGRMGVVAPTTGVVGAAIPVVVGFAIQGVPPPAVIAGIVLAMAAVVLVTRAPGEQADHPSGLKWALAAGIAIGGFNLCIAGLSGEVAFGSLVVMRLTQAVLWPLVILLWRQPWRLPGGVFKWLILIGLLDMAGNGAFILATQTGMLAIAAVLASLYPVTTVLLAILVLHERLSRSHVVGIALTALAIALIAGGSAAA